MRRSASKTPATAQGNGRATRKCKPDLKIARDTQATGDDFVWDEDESAGKNAAALGRRLASFDDSFRQPGYGNGLVVIPPDGKAKLVNKGADLASIIMDRVPVQVLKDGKPKGNKIAAAHLNTMVHAESFLGQFRAVDLVTPTPLFSPRLVANPSWV